MSNGNLLTTGSGSSVSSAAFRAMEMSSFFRSGESDCLSVSSRKHADFSQSPQPRGPSPVRVELLMSSGRSAVSSSSDRSPSPSSYADAHRLAVTRYARALAEGCDSAQGQEDNFGVGFHHMGQLDPEGKLSRRVHTCIYVRIYAV